MLRVDHVVFPIHDPLASLAFYGDILGLPLIATNEGDDWGGKPWLMMIFALADGRELVLVALRGGPRPAPPELAADLRHYAFSVESVADQAAFKSRLVAGGVDFWEEDHGAQQSLYFPDPDGVILEITTPASRPAATPSVAARESVLRWARHAPADA